MEKMSCPHNRIQGDNYGETCLDCGEVLNGYGYWAETGAIVCKHQFLPIGDDKVEMCSFCGEEREASNG
jgi:hypothetical protein